MATKNSESQPPRLSDEAVKAKTGKTWKEWFTILDKAGAKKLSHPEIVKILSEQHGVSSWWRQMVTVTYEQARGMRELHQKPGGFEISVSRTINVPLAKLYKAFETAKARSVWLAEDSLAVGKTKANKTIRGAWNEVATSLEISFIPKSEIKSQVVVTHRKLPNAKASVTMKAFWGKALDRLRALLEK